MVKNDLPSCSGFTALRYGNPVGKKGPKFFILESRAKYDFSLPVATSLTKTFFNENTGGYKRKTENTSDLR